MFNAHFIEKLTLHLDHIILCLPASCWPMIVPGPLLSCVPSLQSGPRRTRVPTAGSSAESVSTYSLGSLLDRAAVFIWDNALFLISSICFYISSLCYINDKTNLFFFNMVTFFNIIIALNIYNTDHA